MSRHDPVCPHCNGRGRIAPLSFEPGDRAIAKGHPGEVLAVYGAFIWHVPDKGNRHPWSVEIAHCRREPPQLPSAEVLNFGEVK